MAVVGVPPAVADEWMAVAKGIPGRPWMKVTLLNESGLTHGLTPEKWAARFEGKLTRSRDDTNRVLFLPTLIQIKPIQRSLADYWQVR